MLVPGLSSAKRGVLLGSVVEVRGRRVVAETVMDVSAGDGIAFDGDRTQDAQQGGRVYEVVRRGSQVELGFARGAIDVERLWCGQKIWKTEDPRLTARLRKTFDGHAISPAAP